MDQWLGIAQIVVGGGLTALLFVAGHVIAGMKASVERRFEAVTSRLDGTTREMERRFSDTEKRMDKAGQKQSDLTDKLHMLPERETVNRIWEEVSQMRQMMATIDLKATKDSTLYGDQIADLRLRLRAVEERRDGGDRREGHERRAAERE